MTLREQLERWASARAQGHAKHTGFGYHYTQGFTACLDLLWPVIEAAQDLSKQIKDQHQLWPAEVDTLDDRLIELMEKLK